MKEHRGRNRNERPRRRVVGNRGGHPPATDPVEVLFLGERVSARSVGEVVAALEARVIQRMARLPPPVVVSFQGRTRVAWSILGGWQIGEVIQGQTVYLYTWKQGQEIGADGRPPSALVTALRVAVAKDAWDGEGEMSDVLLEWNGLPETPEYARADFRSWAQYQKRFRLAVAPLTQWFRVEAKQATTYARAFAEGRMSLRAIVDAIGAHVSDMPQGWCDFEEQPRSPTGDDVLRQLKDLLHERGVYMNGSLEGADILLQAWAWDERGEGSSSPKVRRLPLSRWIDLLEDLRDVDRSIKGREEKALAVVRRWAP